MKKILLLLLSITVFAFANNNNEEEQYFQERSEAFKKLYQTISIVEQFYIDKKDINEIVNQALKGLMTNLDPHSNFMDENETKNLNTDTTGEFGGVGIVVTMKDKVLTVVSPIEDTPGFRAGLKTNDIILKINEQSTLDLSINEAIKLMRGKVGTDLNLTIVREGENKPLEVSLKRDIIEVESVKHKIYTKDDKKILIIRIASFNAKVYSKMKTILDNNKDVSGIVLDLRGNPGGLLDQAVLVSQEFLKNGQVIVSQKGRENSSFAKDTDKEILSDNTKPNTKPLIVLVNEGSASASEIVSGALQDNKRALIIGQKTFGKGTVQVVLPVNEKEALKLTIAKYYLPSGRSIQNKGIEPDFVVPQPNINFEENTTILKESNLKNTLKVKYFEETKKEEDKKDLTKEKNSEILSEENLIKDYQLLIGIFKLQPLL